MTAIATFIVIIFWLPFKGLSMVVSDNNNTNEKILGYVLMFVGLLMLKIIGL